MPSSPVRSVLSLLCAAAPSWAAGDLMIADFEGETYAPWQVTGEAFGPGPARGSLQGQMAVEGFKGKGLVNSFFRGDDATGTLTSPEFRIERNFLSFLIGGGMNPEKLALQLLIDGKPVRSATGPNHEPGGSETLVQESWDVSEFLGRTAVIRIVDEAKGGWGHLNVDHLRQTGTRPPGILSRARRDFTVAKRYLSIPVKTGAPRRVVTLLVDGLPVVRNDIELAPGTPDWTAPMDVSAWQGKTVTLEVDKLPEESTGLSSIVQSDTLEGADNLYREPLRGQFHFSPQRGWNNDPNGMVFHNGEYHLFFQHNPYGWNWGNMHWGHAVSPDMVHWRELGDTLAPDSMGPVFSGSAVVDRNNTSGLGKNGQPPLVLIYTAAGNPTVQCLASGTDGRHFTRFPGNPVVKEISGGNRDPKVLWHEPTKKWVMVLYVEAPGKRHTVHFFTSPNLRDWSLASITEGGTDGDKYLFECPDFFALPVDGNPANTKWVLTAADSNYAVGTFDGTTFKPEHSRLQGHSGRGFYAAQTFSGIPDRDGRRIQIGWFQTETPGMPFNQSMSLPLELQLVSTPDGPRLTFSPVRELETLRARSRRFDPFDLTPGAANPLADIKTELVELRTAIDPGQASAITCTVRGAALTWDVKKQELTVNGHRTAAPRHQGQLQLTVFCDRTGLEIFTGGNRIFIPLPFRPDPENRSLSLSADGGPARVSALEVHELKSAWNR